MQRQQHPPTILSHPTPPNNPTPITIMYKEIDSQLEIPPIGIETEAIR